MACYPKKLGKIWQMLLFQKGNLEQFFILFFALAFPFWKIFENLKEENSHGSRSCKCHGTSFFVTYLSFLRP
jgi:hypothetical protein